MREDRLKNEKFANSITKPVDQAVKDAGIEKPVKDAISQGLNEIQKTKETIVPSIIKTVDKTEESMGIPKTGRDVINNIIEQPIKKAEEQALDYGLSP